MLDRIKRARDALVPWEALTANGLPWTAYTLASMTQGLLWDFLRALTNPDDVEAIQSVKDGLLKLETAAKDRRDLLGYVADEVAAGARKALDILEG